MQKKFILILFALFFINTANAKVCFLPDIFGNNPECLGGETSICSYDRTTPCPTGYISHECTSDSQTYYSCECPSNTRKENISFGGNTKYLCSEDFPSECGCPTEKVTCNRSLYPYTQEKCSRDFPGTTAGGNFCKEGSTTYYEKCLCGSEYQYTCDESHLVPGSLKCRDSDNNDKYTYCSCDGSKNWQSGNCSENNNGCTFHSATKTTQGITCYQCTAPLCKRGTTNLQAKWCSGSLNLNCISLGYKNKSVKQFCMDNSQPLKCPFDSQYYYCQSPNKAVTPSEGEIIAKPIEGNLGELNIP